MRSSFWIDWLIFCGMITGRYFLAAGSAHWLFYRCLSKRFTLVRQPPPQQSIFKDIKLSVCSAAIFALSAALIMLAYDSGMTRLYTSWQLYGLWYLGVSFVGVLVLQDAYFYFTHRAFHQRALFRWLHRGHHASRTPTPWTSFAFDPPEAVIQSLFILGVVFVVPLHFATLAALLATMTIWSVINHLGFQLFSYRPLNRWLGNWLIGPAHHLLHHRRYTLHYGLYFTFWDRLLGTHYADYLKQL
ncbi:MAG: sterol desaturase family protein [Leptolyngbya sp. SIO4C1]|nr:sterol desaturase family protein [Leptolyngbya sp. SIO4C1]